MRRERHSTVRFETRATVDDDDVSLASRVDGRVVWLVGARRLANEETLGEARRKQKAKLNVQMDE